MNIELIEQAFERNFTEHEELGASISIWQAGEPILELGAGFTSKETKKEEQDKQQSNNQTKLAEQAFLEADGAIGENVEHSLEKANRAPRQLDNSDISAKRGDWDIDTMVPVYSATKAPAAITMLWLLEKYGLNPQTKVAKVWNRFPHQEANFAQMLSHQCGLSALDMVAKIDDYEAVIHAIENQQPKWNLGEGHGYHPRTFGFLLDEAARQLCGQRIGEVWNRELAAPLNLEFYIGIPDHISVDVLAERVAPLYPGKAKASLFQNDPFYSKLSDLQSLTGLSFASPRGVNSVLEMNQPKVWELALPSMGGIGTASALAQFYQATLGYQKTPVLSEQVRNWFTQSQTQGHDQVLQIETHFGMGCMMNAGLSSPPFGRGVDSPHAYGHPGAGGSVAYADPDQQLSFAYTMNQMTLSVLPNEKSQSIMALL